MAPNDEFIREVDEEYRRDQLAQIWQRYNGIIIGIVVLIVASVGGWRYWQHHQETRAQAAALRYEEALRLSSEDKGQEAQSAFEALAKEDGGNGYAMLARFRLAAELGQQNAENGASAFDALANDASVPALWKDLARLRAAWLRLDTAEPARIRQALEPLAAPSNAWRHSARELLGLSGLKAGDMDYAGRWFDQIAADRETPATLRQRLAVYTALVAGGPVQATQ
ncbi:tetratricopeptide repeat protein [Microvirga arsenatis]|uniref:Tetratricopeptide repeat protein n=1 Tax=Microvirga arsenatis TaxID=2692265 RepID=A0ABW9YT17_9HYPH|nr:tetratricopeptide repeat protein [Microvirga arsenatis]NBJ10172.1 tetratricopeptide repeat protein [Microvirga arsenatis]NBJ23240.1 tetratricopeptide repeat protein [Microvirga arsenatis]